MLSTREVAKRLKEKGFEFSSDEIASLARKGIFPGVSKDSGGNWQIPPEAVDFYVRLRRQRRMNVIKWGSIVAVITLFLTLISSAKDGLDLIRDYLAPKPSLTLTLASVHTLSPAVTFTATSIATSTPTPTATSTRTPTSTATSTRTPTSTATSTTSTPVSSGGIIAFGPEDGVLTHVEDDTINYVNAGVDLRNFVVEAVFYNPYPLAKGAWDIGFLFRQTGRGDQLRLVIQSDGDWFLYNRWDYKDDLIGSGKISDLDVSIGGSNRVTLLALDDKGILLLNSAVVSELDLSSRTSSGDISVAAGIISGDSIAGAETIYEDFIVWLLP